MSTTEDRTRSVAEKQRQVRNSIAVLSLLICFAGISGCGLSKEDVRQGAASVIRKAVIDQYADCNKSLLAAGCVGITVDVTLVEASSGIYTGFASAKEFWSGSDKCRGQVEEDCGSYPRDDEWGELTQPEGIFCRVSKFNLERWKNRKIAVYVDGDVVTVEW